MKSSQDGRSLFDFVSIAAIWAAAVALTKPIGNFPLDDDWDFAIATWRFARTGHFQFTPFTAVSLRAQVLWGAAWTKLFGESFNVLRASTLTLSLALIWVVFVLLGRAGASRSLRFVATLVFAFHPIFFWATCTYMTEVPFVLASAVALYFFLRALSEDRCDLLFAGCMAVVVSWFVRQTGIANLFGPLALLCILRGRLTKRWKLFAAIVSVFIALFAALLVFKREWLAGSPQEFASHFKMWREVTFRIPEQIALIRHYLAYNAQNAALFVLPFSAALVLPLQKLRRWWWLVLGVMAVVVGAVVWEHISLGRLLPYSSTYYQCCNTLVNWGLGQQTLSDVWMMSGSYPVHLAYGARMALTFGGFVVAVLLLTHLLRALFQDDRLFVRLTAATAIAGTLTLFGSGFYTDRYSFDSAWSVGLLLPMIVAWNRRRVRAIAIVCLLSLAVFDVLAIQEYFAWNRARWASFDALRAKGIAVQRIDGGVESFNLLEMANMNRDQSRLALISNRPRQYVLAFRPLPGLRVIDRRPYHGWLAAKDGAIYTLER